MCEPEALCATALAAETPVTLCEPPLAKATLLTPMRAYACLQVTEMFGVMATSLPQLRAVGTWGTIPLNASGASVWYSGLENFVKGGQELGRI
jgi:hypothetical protein